MISRGPGTRTQPAPIQMR